MFERKPQTPYPIGYPAREDFDPARVPYPLDLKAKRFLSSLCMMLAVGSSEAEAGGTDAPENPFSPGAVTFETRYPIMFGTGMPSSLTEAEVLPVIKEVFEQAGIELNLKQMVKEDRLEFEIDGLSATGSILAGWVDGTLDAVDRKIARDAKGFSPEEVKFITERSTGVPKRFLGFIDASRYDHHPQEWNDPKDPARQEAIEKLRKDVKQFLDWAWSQGAF